MGNILHNYVTMRPYIYDVQPENKHCLGCCSDIFPEEEANWFSLPPNNLWIDRGNIISDTNLVINENVTEELLLEYNPRLGKHRLIDF